MTKCEQAAALRADPNVHYNCAQSVIIPFAEELGFTPEQANALALNFGGGMGCGSVCGAVTGALMVMGGMGLPQEKRLDLIRQFRADNGALDCAELIQINAETGKPKKEHCDRMVVECTRYVCRALGLE